MIACILSATGRIETNPLRLKDMDRPEPGLGEVLVRVKLCGVCRTDLHVIEGELPPKKSPLIPRETQRHLEIQKKPRIDRKCRSAMCPYQRMCPMHPRKRNKCRWNIAA